MNTIDQNSSPEQRRPRDVSPKVDDGKFADEGFMPAPAVQPVGAKDESVCPVVNPVTGGDL